MSDVHGQIAVLTHGYAPRLGGIERQRAAITPRLVARGLDAVVVTRAVPGTPRHETKDGVDIVRTPRVAGGRRSLGASIARAADSSMFTVVALATLLRRRPDVIYAHEFLSTARVGVLAARIMRIPIVVTAHLSGPVGDVQRSTRTAARRRLLRAIRRHSALVIAVSREIDSELAEAGFPDEQRLIITNGVDTVHFQPASANERRTLRRDLELSDGPVVVFAGRLEQQKRVDRLLDAWSDVHLKHPDAILLVLGSGSLESVLRDGADSSVQFRGTVADTAPYLRAADAFVLPSDAEGLSNALLEAQACGLPAVVTDVGAAREVIIDGVNGRITAPDDVEGLSRALIELLADEPTRRAMSLAARRRTVEHFSVEQTADRFAETFTAVRSMR